ncbi:hypothetical protein MMC20_003012 [Loxospora ochrophaea]|nr:hypothetical protein [Loxospora ochrophaea]
MPSNNDTGATGAAKFVTSTVGNTVGGLASTVGHVTGAAGRGIGDTINSATGSVGRPLGDGLKSVTDGIEAGAVGTGKGIEDAGKRKHHPFD